METTNTTENKKNKYIADSDVRLQQHRDFFRELRDRAEEVVSVWMAAAEKAKAKGEMEDYKAALDNYRAECKVAERWAKELEEINEVIYQRL